jgi:hypothetical protein
MNCIIFVGNDLFIVQYPLVSLYTDLHDPADSWAVSFRYTRHQFDFVILKTTLSYYFLHRISYRDSTANLRLSVNSPTYIQYDSRL